MNTETRKDGNNRQQSDNIISDDIDHHFKQNIQETPQTPDGHLDSIQESHTRGSKLEKQGIIDQLEKSDKLKVQFKYEMSDILQAARNGLRNQQLQPF